MAQSFGSESATTNPTNVEQKKELATINPTNIEQKKERLKQELQFNKTTRNIIIYSVATGVALTVGVCAYKIFLAAPAAGKVATKIPSMLSIVVPSEILSHEGTKEEKKFVFVSAYNEYLIKEQYKNASFISWSFTNIKKAFTSLGKDMAIMSLFSVANSSLGPIGKIMAKLDGLASRTLGGIFHEGDLQWYLDSHTTLRIHIDQMICNARALEGKILIPVSQDANEDEVDAVEYKEIDILLSEEDYRDYKNTIALHWNSLIDQCEGILSFIDYLDEQSPDIFKISLISVRTTYEQLKRVLNDKQVELSNLLEQGEPCSDLIGQLDARIQMCLQEFKALCASL